ncbi:unnamed protein product [Gordionus sp. m RMFG-2023]
MNIAIDTMEVFTPDNTMEALKNVLPTAVLMSEDLIFGFGTGFKISNETIYSLPAWKRGEASIIYVLVILNYDQYT